MAEKIVDEYRERLNDSAVCGFVALAARGLR